MYREWCTDSSPLMNAALKNGQVLQAQTSAATPLGTTDTFAGDFFGQNNVACCWKYVLTCLGVALLLWLVQQLHQPNNGYNVHKYRHELTAFTGTCDVATCSSILISSRRSGLNSKQLLFLHRLW